MWHYFAERAFATVPFDYTMKADGCMKTLAKIPLACQLVLLLKLYQTLAVKLKPSRPHLVLKC